MGCKTLASYLLTSFVGGAHSSTPSDVNYIPTLFEDALEEGDTFRCAQGEPEQPGAPTSPRATPVEPDTNLPEPEHEIPDVPGEVPEQEHLSVSRTPKCFKNVYQGEI